MPDSEQLGEEMAPLGIEMVAEAMKSHPEDRRREAEEVFAWCTNNIVPGQFHDPVQVTMQIMQEAMAREVSAAALLNHLDFLNLRDCLNPAGVRQWACLPLPAPADVLSVILVTDFNTGKLSLIRGPKRGQLAKGRFELAHPVQVLPGGKAAMFEILTLNRRPLAGRVATRFIVNIGKGGIETVRLPRATEVRTVTVRDEYKLSRNPDADPHFTVNPHPPDIRWVSDNLCLSVVSDGDVNRIGTYLFNRRTGKDRHLTSRAADLQRDIALLDGRLLFFNSTPKIGNQMNWRSEMFKLEPDEWKDGDQAVICDSIYELSSVPIDLGIKAEDVARAASRVDSERSNSDERTIQQDRLAARLKDIFRFSHYQYDPATVLLEGRDKHLYVVCKTGKWDASSIVRMKKDGTSAEVVLSLDDPRMPGLKINSLIAADDGSIYGSAVEADYRNSQAIRGCLFKFSPDKGSTEVLYAAASIKSAKGSNAIENPYLSYVSPEGDLYGLCNQYLGQSLFRFSTSSGKLEVLHNGGEKAQEYHQQENQLLAVYVKDPNPSHTYLDNPKKGQRIGKELIRIGNKFYFCTEKGGRGDRGTICSINIDGTGYQILYEFAPLGDEGNLPIRLSGGPDGRLHGITAAGGRNHNGCIFSFDPADNSCKTLFGGQGKPRLDRFLFTDDNNVFFGTSSPGGIVRLNLRSNKVETLTDLGYHTNISSLILASNGKFYGTTAEQVFSQSLDDSNEEPDRTAPVEGAKEWEAFCGNYIGTSKGTIEGSSEVRSEFKLSVSVSGTERVPKASVVYVGDYFDSSGGKRHFRGMTDLKVTSAGKSFVLADDSARYELDSNGVLTYANRQQTPDGLIVLSKGVLKRQELVFRVE